MAGGSRRIQLKAKGSGEVRVEGALNELIFVGEKPPNNKERGEENKGGQLKQGCFKIFTAIEEPAGPIKRPTEKEKIPEGGEPCGGVGSGGRIGQTVPGGLARAQGAWNRLTKGSSWTHNCSREVESLTNRKRSREE